MLLLSDNQVVTPISMGVVPETPQTRSSSMMALDASMLKTFLPTELVSSTGHAATARETADRGASQ